MVGVDPSLKDELFKPEFWPNGIGWTRCEPAKDGDTIKKKKIRNSDNTFRLRD